LATPQLLVFRSIVPETLQPDDPVTVIDSCRVQQNPAYPSTTGPTYAPQLLEYRTQRTHKRRYR